MDIEKVGAAIAYLRKRAGFTQKDLADRLGISDKAVSKWERGLGLPDVAYLGKLSIILDTDTDSLLQGDIIHHDQGWKGLLIIDENSCKINASTEKKYALSPHLKITPLSKKSSKAAENWGQSFIIPLIKKTFSPTAVL